MKSVISTREHPLLGVLGILGRKDGFFWDAAIGNQVYRGARIEAGLELSQANSSHKLLCGATAKCRLLSFLLEAMDATEL